MSDLSWLKSSINNSVLEISKKSNASKNNVNYTRAYWQGEAAESFEQAYEVLQKKGNNVHSKFSSLPSKLVALQSSINQAEEAKRRDLQNRKKK